ncbi:MAG: ABC transporter permease [Armatimonadota bacterium]
MAPAAYLSRLTLASADLTSQKGAAKSFDEPFWRRREFVLGVALVLLALAVGALRPDFLRWENLRDILLNAAIPTVAAAGMTVLIINAQIDISIGAILAVSAVVVALSGQKGLPLPLLALVGAGSGALLGAVNGTLTAGLKIPSIVATLATVGAIRGLMIWVTEGDIIQVPAALNEAGAGMVLGLPVLVWAAALVAAGTHLYLSATRKGRQHYAVGSNPRSAELSGISVNGTTFRSFVYLGALTGIAGFLYVLRFSPISHPIAPGFELEVITAVVVGGTDIFGGRGTVLGTVLAVLLLKLIEVGLTFVGSITQLRSEIQPAIQGLLILAAVLYNSLSRHED